MRETVWHPFTEKPTDEGIYDIHISDDVENPDRQAYWKDGNFYDLKTGFVFLLNIDKWTHSRREV